MPKDSEKAQRLREKKERKLLEAQIKQSNEKTLEARTVLETILKATNAPNYQKAIGILDNAIELHPENNEAFILRGNARRDQLLLDEAIDDYTKAIELNGTAYAALEGRATCYELLRDYDRAIQDYASIIRVHPENDHAYNMRGAALLKKRPQGLLMKEADYALVVSDFKTALRLNENNFHARTNLGKAHSDQRNYRDAIQCFTAALKTCDTYRYANYRRACANMALARELARDEDRYTAQLLSKRKQLASPAGPTAANNNSTAAAAGSTSSSPRGSPSSPAAGSGANVAKRKVLMGLRVERVGEDETAAANPHEHVTLEDKLEAVSAERRKCLASAVSDWEKVIDKERKNLEITAVVHLANCYFDQFEDQLAAKEFNDALALIPDDNALAANSVNVQNFLNSTSAQMNGTMMGGTFNGTMAATALLGSTLAMGSVVMAAPLGDTALLKDVINSRLKQITARKEQTLAAAAASLTATA